MWRYEWLYAWQQQEQHQQIRTGTTGVDSFRCKLWKHLLCTILVLFVVSFISRALLQSISWRGRIGWDLLRSARVDRR
eukprot:5317675-Pleurochrysis_carterae.AAC.1